MQLDAISHGSSGTSLNVGAGAGGMGVVSRTSTPNSGSMDLGGGFGTSSRTDLYRQALGTPVNPRRSNPDASGGASGTSPSSTSRSYMLEASSSSKRHSDEPVLDEWEAKLLGKKDPGREGASSDLDPNSCLNCVRR